MELLQNVIEGILNLGAPVVLPIIMILIGLGFGVGFRKAFSAGLLLGVAFAGMNVILGFMFGSIAPAASAFVENTGIQLTAIDLGWTPTAAIAWAWPYAFLMFPLQIAINIVMLALNWTQCLNVDMWNVWNKVLTGVLVAHVTGQVWMAFLMCAIQVVVELKQADWSVYLVEEQTKIPGVALPHSLFFEWIIFIPLNRLLDRIPFFRDRTFEPEAVREQIGVFGENHVIGFFVGLFIAIMAGYDLKGILTLGIEAGTALTLFPMVATLFITALMPIADGAKAFMAARFPGRTFHIGLDWPFTAGLSSIWVAAILNVPILILWAIVLPGNIGLPFGGIIALATTITAAICTRNDVVRTTILTWITQPLWVYAGTFFAQAITDLGRAVETVEIPPDVQYITWIGMEMPSYRLAASTVGAIFTKGEIFPGVLIGAIVVALFFFARPMLIEENRKSGERMGKYEALEAAAAD
jgi:PTS system galactitol-specific IIC component